MKTEKEYSGYSMEELHVERTRLEKERLSITSRDEQDENMRNLCNVAFYIGLTLGAE